MKDGRLPNLVVIGAQKCGTTSLHYYLRSHPEIFMTNPKELQFFVQREDYPQLSVEWYRSNFRTSLPIAGESSPCYTNFPRYKNIPERMADLIPDAKFVYLVRDPIDRIISQYRHYQSLMGEDRPFEQAVFEGDSLRGYLSRSKYFFQLERYLKFFKEEQILVLSTNVLDNTPMEAMNTVCRFLGLSNRVDPQQFTIRRNTSIDKQTTSPLQRELLFHSTLKLKRHLPQMVDPVNALLNMKTPWSKPIMKPEISEEFRERLAKELLPDVTKLRQFTGQAFSDWSL